MAKIRYVGPYPRAYFESPKHGAYEVDQGDVVDVPDADLVASLLDQPTNWQPVAAAKESK